MCGVEGTRQPTRDRGNAVSDPPSPVGAQGTPSHLQPCVGATALYAQCCREWGDKAEPPGWHLQRGPGRQVAPWLQWGWGKDPNPPGW